MYRTIFSLLALLAAVRADVTYMFPDDASYFEGAVKSLIGTDDGTLIVITPALRHHAFRNAIEKRLMQARETTVATQAPVRDDAAYLTQYASFTPRSLTGLAGDETRGRLAMTLLLSESRACTVTLPLDRGRLRRDIGLGRCTSDADDVQRYRKIATLLLERSKPYLK